MEEYLLSKRSFKKSSRVAISFSFNLTSNTFLAAIAALYRTMSVGWSVGLSVGLSVSTSFKVAYDTKESVVTCYMIV